MNLLSRDQLFDIAKLHQRVLSGGVIDIDGRIHNNKNVARPFDYTSSVDLPGVGLSSTVLEFVVPKGYDAIVRRYAIVFDGGGFVQSSGDIVWRLLSDGKAVPNFENIDAERGKLDSLRELDDLVFYSGQVVTLQVIHVANAALNGKVLGVLNGAFLSRQRNQ